MNKDLQAKMQELQMLEHNLQSSLMQHQQMHGQMVELESATKELDTAKSAFKIIGNIMVATDPSKLKEELEDKKKIIDLRLKSFEKQEGQLRERATSLKTEVMGELQKEEK